VRQCVLFDLGDTLIDGHPLDQASTEKQIARSFEIWLRRKAMRAGEEFSPDERVRLAAVEGARLVRAVNQGLDGARQAYWAEGREAPALSAFTTVRAELAAASGLFASLSELEEIYLKARMARQRAMPGAVDLLTRLGAHGVRRGLVSNCLFSREPMQGHLRGQGLAGLLDTTIFSSEVGWRKPRREPFLAALGALAVSPNNAVHVGDDLVADIEGAAGAGLAAIWLWGHHPLLERVEAGEARGPGTWPDLAGHPDLARKVEALLAAPAPAALVGAARTLAEVGELLFAGQ